MNIICMYILYTVRITVPMYRILVFLRYCLYLGLLMFQILNDLEFVL